VTENLPTYRAVLTIPAGLDETRLAVVDDTSVIAETTWRPADNYQPGPATWDWRLHASATSAPPAGSRTRSASRPPSNRSGRSTPSNNGCRCRGDQARPPRALTSRNNTTTARPSESVGPSIVSG
jgi:hypothetical protein